MSDMAGTHSFSFDRVFGPDVRQVDVFGEVARPVVDGKSIVVMIVNRTAKRV